MMNWVLMTNEVNVDRKVQVNDTATIQCNVYYDYGFESMINITCLEHGKFDRDLDHCQVQTVDCPQLDHGTVKVFASGIYSLVCEKGYRLSKKGCRFTGCSNQSFTCGNVTCEPQNCKLKASAGTLSNNELKKKETIELAHNSSIIVGCDDGLEPAAVLYTCSFGNISGNSTEYPTQSGKMPLCRKDCRIPDGYSILMMEEVNEDRKVQVNDTATIQCNVFFDIGFDSMINITCLEHGKFDRDLDPCKETTITATPAINNTGLLDDIDPDISDSNETPKFEGCRIPDEYSILMMNWVLMTNEVNVDRKVQVNDTATIKCNVFQDYGFESMINITCLEHGKFDRDLDPCKVQTIDCPQLDHGTVEVFTPGIYSVVCEKGYRLSNTECRFTECSNQNFTCGNVICEPQTCKLEASAGTLSNNELKKKETIDLAHNSSIIVGCDDGLEPAAVLYTCSFGNISGNSTEYPTKSGKMPQCRKAVCDLCNNGECIRDETCRCFHGYDGPYCDPENCKLKASAGTLSNNELKKKETIELAHNSSIIVGCDEGLEPAAVLYTCSFGYISGNSTDYPTQSGKMPQCRKAVCDLCNKGECIRDETCRCFHGYDGPYCDPVLTEYRIALERDWLAGTFGTVWVEVFGARGSFKQELTGVYNTFGKTLKLRYTLKGIYVGEISNVLITTSQSVVLNVGYVAIYSSENRKYYRFEAGNKRRSVCEFQRRHGTPYTYGFIIHLRPAENAEECQMSCVGENRCVLAWFDKRTTTTTGADLRYPCIAFLSGYNMFTVQTAGVEIYAKLCN